MGGEGARLGLDVWFQALMVLPTFLHEGMPNGSGSSLQRHARHAGRLLSIRLHILVGRELDGRHHTPAAIGKALDIFRRRGCTDVML